MQLNPVDKLRMAGFTLLEVLLVLVIFSITVGLVAPVIGRFGTIETQAAARKLGTSLNFAKNLAIRKKTACFVEVRNGSILIASSDKGPEREIPLSKDVIVSHSPTATFFFPRGGSNGGDYSIIGKNGAEFIVRVSSSGQVRIEKSNPG